MLEITKLFPLFAALGCAVCAETVEVVEPVVCCVFVAVVAVVVVVVVGDVALAITVFGLKPGGKYSTPFGHDLACATVRLATGKSALVPVAVVRLSDEIFTFRSTA